MRAISSVLAIDERRLAELCARYRVVRLELFGSGTGETFQPDSSDLDFLVQFQSMPPADHAGAYFGLHDALEALFHRPVDLVELQAIRNPYFLEAIEHSRIVLYAA